MILFAINCSSLFFRLPGESRHPSRKSRSCQAFRSEALGRPTRQSVSARPARSYASQNTRASRARISNRRERESAPFPKACGEVLLLTFPSNFQARQPHDFFGSSYARSGLLQLPRRMTGGNVPSELERRRYCRSVKCVHDRPEIVDSNVPDEHRSGTGCSRSCNDHAKFRLTDMIAPIARHMSNATDSGAPAPRMNDAI